MIDFAALGIAINAHGATEQRVACPQCEKGSRDQALGVNIDTGAFHCFRCEWKGRAGGESVAPIRPISRADDQAIVQRRRERLRRIAGESVALTHTAARVVRRYLEARALGAVLQSPPTVLRAHPGLEYWDGTQSRGRFPAMLAVLRGASGDPVTLHCTYLRSDGCAKAAVPSPKKILGVPVRGATRGGAIHLYEPRDGVLGIAEGIETALSLGLLQDVPVWAAFCAGNLVHVRLPAGLRELYIGCDLDESGKGEQSAKALALRVSAWQVPPTIYICRPEVDAPGDLNDELRRRAG